MKIKKLIAHCRVSEASAVGAQIAATFDEYTIENWPIVLEIVADIKECSSKIINAWKRDEYESDLAEKDLIRDEKCRALFYTITGACYNPDALKQAAAKRVMVIFNKYGLEMLNKSYDDESADIKSLLTDLSCAEATEDIAKIDSLSTIVSELITAQNQFDQAVTDWKIASGNGRNKKSATSMKKQMVELINGELIPLLKVLLKREKATFLPFATTVVKIINDKNRLIDMRGKGKGERGKVKG